MSEAERDGCTPMHLDRCLSLDEYQQTAGKTAIYPYRDLKRYFSGLLYPAFGLGDVLWYVAELATALGTTMSRVATENIDKLQRRSEAGQIQGQGVREADLKGK